MKTKTKKSSGSQTILYPLQFEPIYQYRLWGGRHLADLLTVPLPGEGPIGEAWILSDREDYQSLVANGPRELYFYCEYFHLWLLHGQSPFTVGEISVPRVLVCTSLHF